MSPDVTPAVPQAGDMDEVMVAITRSLSLLENPGIGAVVWNDCVRKFGPSPCLLSTVPDELGVLVLDKEGSLFHLTSVLEAWYSCCPLRDAVLGFDSSRTVAIMLDRAEEQQDNEDSAFALQGVRMLDELRRLFQAMAPVDGWHAAANPWPFLVVAAAWNPELWTVSGGRAIRSSLV
jgi:hypothetical protein